MSETSQDSKFHEPRATLARIIDAVPDGPRESLRAQLPTVVFVQRLTTILDFERRESETAPVDLPDGPIDVETEVLDGDGTYAGEILVWVNGGYLSGMEYASVTEEYPRSWPSDNAVIVRGATSH